MENRLALEADRVRRTTAGGLNERIDAETVANIRRFATHSREDLDRRIRELNEEWDLERTLAAHAAGWGLAGMVLGTTVNRRWFALAAGALGLLLLHQVQGGGPPQQLLRRAGIRTRTEIDREKLALKYVRGDFHPPSPSDEPVREHRRLPALVESGSAPR